MRRRLSLLTLLGLVSCAGPGYRSPPTTAPHAVLAIRNAVHRRGGPLFRAVVRLGRRPIDERVVDSPSPTEYVTRVRVRPGPLRVRVDASSYHRQDQQRWSTREDGQRYTQREAVSIGHDECSAELDLHIRAGGSYLVQFDYVGYGPCLLRCFEQLPAVEQADELELVPCAPVESPPLGPSRRRL